MIRTFVGKEIQKRRIAREPDFLAERLIKEVKPLDEPLRNKRRKGGMNEVDKGR